LYPTYIIQITDHNCWTERFSWCKPNFFSGLGLNNFKPPSLHKHDQITPQYGCPSTRDKKASTMILTLFLIIAVLHVSKIVSLLALLLLYRWPSDKPFYRCKWATIYHLKPWYKSHYPLMNSLAHIYNILISACLFTF